MNLCVVGTGYVGLVTGACFADLGNKVVCVDIDEKKIANLKKGISPIFEPGLEEIVIRNYRQKRLEFTTNLKQGVAKAEAIFIAVGTPAAENGEANLDYVKEVARGIGKTIPGEVVVVDKSTVPVGMGDLVESLIEEQLEKRKVKFRVEVVSCPEFLKEGSAIHDFNNPDRIVIGAKNKKAAQKIAELYKPLSGKILITDTRSSEMIKYASNAFLAVKISFINEIANLCEHVGADVGKVAEGMGMDKRIGAAFLNAGAGYGGSCFPKDVSALVRIAEKEGYEFQILNSVIRVNEFQKQGMVLRIKNAVGTLEGKTIGLLGLAFKPNTDDMREAVSLDVIRGLREKGANVKAYDAAAAKEAQHHFPDLTICENPLETARGAHCLVILTEWNEFKDIDLKKIAQVMKTPIMVDGRNIYDPRKARQAGFTYKSIGRA